VMADFVPQFLDLFLHALGHAVSPPSPKTAAELGNYTANSRSYPHTKSTAPRAPLLDTGAMDC
jgi:hypothetical protein